MIRIVKVIAAALRGDSFCWLNKADRERAAADLDDASFVNWARWAVAMSAKYYADEAEQKQRSLFEIITMHGVIALALLTLKSGGTRGTFDVSNVTYKGESKGDWRVTIERIGDNA